jgi:hypothetical protein
MNPLRKFHFDLQTCELEDRVLPVIANLGVIVLTTGGYVLLIPYPGAAATPGGSTGGAAIPTSFSIMGSGGISSMQPGNITGIPGLAATGTSGSSGVANATINVGSGANDATAPSIPLVTRNTIANDAIVPRPQIGRPSGDGSPILPIGQIYRGGVPESLPSTPSSATPSPGRQSGRSPHASPVDSTPIRLGEAPPRVTPNVMDNSMKVLTDRMP